MRQSFDDLLVSIIVFGTWLKNPINYGQTLRRKTMKLDFNLHLTQKQGLALTAQVQQAIKLLHMTNLEIQEFVESNFKIIHLSKQIWILKRRKNFKIQLK